MVPPVHHAPKGKLCGVHPRTIAAVLAIPKWNCEWIAPPPNTGDSVAVAVADIHKESPCFLKAAQADFFVTAIACWHWHLIGAGGTVAAPGSTTFIGKLTSMIPGAPLYKVLVPFLDGYGIKPIASYETPQDTFIWVPIAQLSTMREYCLS